MMRLPCTTRRRGSLSAALLCSMVATRGPWPLTGADRGQQSEHSQLLAGPGARKGCLAASRILLFSHSSKECERAKEKHEKEAYLDPAKAAACAHCHSLPTRKKVDSVSQAEEHREKGNEFFKAIP